MDKKTTQMIKGVAILIMLAHHFIVFSFSKLPNSVVLFGTACKICVAIYAVLSGYGYFFAREKTVRYGLKKSFGLLQIYWLQLFTLFIPAAVVGGWKLTTSKMLIQLFGLLPNLNWFAWYVFFYIFCMLVMPLLYKYQVFRFKPLVNLGMMFFIPYIFEVMLYMIPNYEANTILHDLYSCFLYFPCFLIGYWMAENHIVEKSKQIKWLHNSGICLIGIIAIFSMRIIVNSIAGFLLDVIYAPVIICCLVNLFENKRYKKVPAVFNILGKYSTEMWFFHAVFFSTYVCDWFQPILKLASWPPLMFVWFVSLSLLGAVVYQKVLDGLRSSVKFVKRSL